jgi:hypothetical protein
MHRLRTILIAILTIVPVGTVAATEGLPDTAPPTLTPQEQALVEWAFDRFEAAGLDLPDGIRIEFHRSKEPCGGNEGLHRRGRIDVCRFVDGNPEAEDYLRRHALLHELAHEWTDHALSGDRQQAFMTQRGVARWNDHDDDWLDRGTEHAAEIMVWALLDREAGFLNLYDASCSSMTEGFRTLTGTNPLSPEFPCAG